MPVVSFFKPVRPLPIADVCALIGIGVPDGVDHGLTVASVDSIERASAGDLTFASGSKARAALARLDGAVVIVAPALAAAVPAGCVALVHRAAQPAFAKVARTLYPESVRSPDFAGLAMKPGGAHVHPRARLERGVTLAPGAVVGADAEIGSGTRIGPGAVIGPGSAIGRNCDVGANAVIQCALIGDGVIIGPGAVIGHDGFGHAPGPQGLEKVPQLGRVILQNGVEIGAGTCIDRGALADTVIGEGTKIDNLCQIAHNVRIGRHCVIAAKVGVSGSVTIGDGCMIGGQAGFADHVTVGSGVMIAAQTGVMRDVAPGSKIAGSPARPARTFFREVAALGELAEKTRGGEQAGTGAAHDDT